MIFSRRNVNMAADARCWLHSMSRNGQLTGLCHALPNFIWKLREHNCATLKRNTHALFSSPACSILASEVDLICLARNSHFTGFCHALSKMIKGMACTKTRNSGIWEHRNTLEHSGTPQSTPEHRNSRKTPEHRIWRCCFVFPLQTMSKIKCQCNLFTHVTWKGLGSGSKNIEKKVKRKTEKKCEEIKNKERK